MVIPRVALAAILEPAYDVAGDSFDYAINDDILHLAVIDAMGHGRNAAMLATLAICDYQHARRANTGLADLYGQLYEAIHHQFGPEQFVTAQMMRFDAPTGRLQWVNAGHPVPLLIRDHRVIQARTPTRRGAVRAGALHQLRGARSARRRRRAADGPGTVALPDPSPRRHDRPRHNTPDDGIARRLRRHCGPLTMPYSPAAPDRVPPATPLGSRWLAGLGP
jgi:Stage II sporulation protein E (SpoIIE)